MGRMFEMVITSKFIDGYFPKALNQTLCTCLAELVHILLVQQTDPTIERIIAKGTLIGLICNLNMTAVTIPNSSKPIITRQIQ